MHIWEGSALASTRLPVSLASGEIEKPQRPTEEEKELFLAIAGRLIKASEKEMLPHSIHDVVKSLSIKLYQNLFAFYNWVISQFNFLITIGKRSIFTDQHRLLSFPAKIPFVFQHLFPLPDIIFSISFRFLPSLFMKSAIFFMLCTVHIIVNSIFAFLFPLKRNPLNPLFSFA